MFNKLKTLEDKFTVTKAAVIVGVFSLLAKFLAIYRERLFGETFGQDRILDTYFSAFRVPDFITNLLVLSTLSVAFLPVFAGLLTYDKKKAVKTANAVLNLASLGVGAVSLLLLVFSRQLTKILIPGFSQDYFEITLKLTRLFLLSPVIFAASTVFGGYLNANKKFLIASFAPLLYNLGIILGVIFLYPKFGIMGLGYGVIIGALAQLAVQISAAASGGFRWMPLLGLKDEATIKIAKLYLPRILAFDLSNVTLLLGSVLGSFLAEGSITALNQAYNLEAVPVGIFAYSLALAMFPPLSEYYALGDEKKFLQTLLKILRQLLFFMVPITVLMLLYRAYIVRLILGFGKFDWKDTVTTFTILGIFSLSLLTQSLTTVLSRAFFARQNTKIPVIVNIISIIFNLIFGAILGKTYGIYGLAAAFSISSVINACLLFIIMRRRLGRKNTSPVWLKNFDSELFSSLLKIVFSSLFMGITCYIFIYALEPFFNTKTAFGILAQSSASGALGVAVYLACGHALDLQESKLALDFLKKFLESARGAAKIDNR